MTLTWAEVRPNTHLFNPDAIESLVRPLVPEEKNTDVNWERAITDALVATYGAWARGWSYASSEPGGGGPVHAWCCAAHSWAGPAETARKVKEALTEWRVWLERLGARFDELAPADRTEGATLQAFEAATLILVNEVVVQTNAEDAWYSHCNQVLEWYLEHHGFSSELAQQLVTEAIGGRFHSWSEPEQALVAEVATSLALSAAEKAK